MSMTGMNLPSLDFIATNPFHAFTMEIFGMDFEMVSGIDSQQ